MTGISTRTSITLRPGFTATYGCNFQVTPTGCNFCDPSYGNLLKKDITSQELNENSEPEVKKSNMNSGFINIYPNPTHGIVSVILPENPSISYIECFDTFGNRIYYSQVTKNEINVDLSNKQDGLYIFKIYFSNTIYYFKIVLLK